MLPTFVEWMDRAIAATSGRRYPRYLVEARAMERWTPEAIAAWQRRRLAALLEHARTQAPYWREVLGATGLSSETLAEPEHFARLPFLTKEIFRTAGDALRAERGFDDRRVTRSSTGGSTGRNIWFVLDLETHDRRRAVARLTDAWEDVRPGTRIVTLWGSPLDSTPSRKARLYDALANRMFLSAYGIDDATVRGFGERLRRFRPRVVLSYPSILLHTARRLGRGFCRDLRLARVFTSAEVLYPSVREELEDLFGCPVRNRYASREFGMIAAQCPETDALHVMDPRFHVETVAFDAGTPELVVTDLDNRALPFIRYRIEDRSRFLDGPCACGRGFRRIEPIDGRVLDVIVTPSGKAFGGTFFTLVLRPKDRSVEEFQVVQVAPDRIRVAVVKGSGWRETTAAEIREKLERHLDGMRCELEIVENIPMLASGKRRFVVGLTPGAGA